MKIKITAITLIRPTAIALMLTASTAASIAQGTIVYGTPQQTLYYDPTFAFQDFQFDVPIASASSPDFELITSLSSGTASLQPVAANQLLVVAGSSFYLAALPQGYSIGSATDSQTMWAGIADGPGQAIIGYGNADGEGISYFLSQTAYAGFDLYYAGANHYGWMQIDNPTELVFGQILDWAYETTPNTPILAGAVPEPGCLSLLTIGGLIFCVNTTIRSKSRAA